MESITIQPRFCETDALGHINNGVLADWFEQARHPFFKIMNPELSFDGWNIILKRTEYEFVAQIYMQHAVKIDTGILSMGDSSVIFDQRAYQNNALVCVGKAVMVFFDFKKQCKQSLPDTLRSQLERHIIEP